MRHLFRVFLQELVFALKNAALEGLVRMLLLQRARRGNCRMIDGLGRTQ